jgi:hypothetical protein
MKKILLGIKTNTASYSSNSSEGYSCGTMEASQVDVVMTGEESEIRDFVFSARKKREELSSLSNLIERAEDSERWDDIDVLKVQYHKINRETRGVNYTKLIMVDGIEL